MQQQIRVNAAMICIKVMLKLQKSVLSICVNNKNCYLSATLTNKLRHKQLQQPIADMTLLCT